MSWCAFYGKIYHLLFVCDCTTGTRFFIDSGTQISSISATKEIRVKGSCKITLQEAVKMSHTELWTNPLVHEPRLSSGFYPQFSNCGCGK